MLHVYMHKNPKQALHCRPGYNALTRQLAGGKPWFIAFTDFGGLNPPPFQAVNMKCQKAELGRELSSMISSQELLQHSPARAFHHVSQVPIPTTVS